MKDIRVDEDGNPRCWNCGGRSFNNKRTFRSKAIGVTAGAFTLGAAGALTPLATRKKLQCQMCGEYNDTGTAKPWEGESHQEAKERKRAERARPTPTIIDSSRQVTEVKGIAGKLTVEGDTLVIKRPMVAAQRIPISEIIHAHMEEDWTGTLGVYFETAHSKPPKKITGSSPHPNTITFPKKSAADAQQLVAQLGL